MAWSTTNIITPPFSYQYQVSNESKNSKMNVMQVEHTLDLAKTCRICMNECDSTIKLSDNKYLLGKIKEIAPIVVEKTDGLPGQICNSCSAEVNRWHLFKLKIMRSDQQLRNILQRRREGEKRGQEESESSCIRSDVELMGSSIVDVETDSEIEMKARIENKPRCAECSRKFSEEQLLIHMRCSHSTVRTYSCQVCSKKSDTRSGLYAHMATHRKIQPPSTCAYVCGVCQKLFASRTGLNFHKYKHPEGEKCFGCIHCGESFIRNSQLVLHTRRKHQQEQERPGPCAPDGSGLVKAHAAYPQLWNRTKPLNLKSRTCDDRNTSFSLLERLGFVTKISKTPQQCDICEKVFKNHTKMMSHRGTTHLGAKPHSCTLSRCTTEDGMMKSHAQVRTGPNLLNCGVCDKAFIHSRALNAHMKNHENLNNLSILLGNLEVSDKTEKKTK